MEIHYLSDKELQSFIAGASAQIIEDETITSPNFFPSFNSKPNTKLTGKYSFIIRTNISEKMVGVSNNDDMIFDVPWELIGKTFFNDNSYFIFSGWGDLYNGGNLQFENKKIGIKTLNIKFLLNSLRHQNPTFVTQRKIENLNGLENEDIAFILKH